jgi:hydroxymethylglutaryl-CoA synthase
LSFSKAAFESKTKPSLLLATSVGNMYTPSLYASLVSYLCQEPVLPDRKLALFSYGSGLASSFFSLQVRGGSGLDKMVKGLKDVQTRLDARTKSSPGIFRSSLLQK